MFGFGFPEIILIVALALIVVGPKRLPEVARAVAKGFAEFKGALDEVQRSVREEVHKPMMEAKSDYLEKILAERDKMLKETQENPQSQSGPPPDGDLSMGTPDNREFSDLPYKKAEAESDVTAEADAETDGDAQNEQVGATEKTPKTDSDEKA
jgi:Tat protein translocase TatB subunit